MEQKSSNLEAQVKDLASELRQLKETTETLAEIVKIGLVNSLMADLDETLRPKYEADHFNVDDYWSENIQGQQDSWKTGRVSLLDTVLHNNFHVAGKSRSQYDLRQILNGTHARQEPKTAVTYVERLDEECLQSERFPIEPWFKPLAYAIILLRLEGFPCVFYGDYQGVTYLNCINGKPDLTLCSQKPLIDVLMLARAWYAFGDQHDYFDHPNMIGWIRTGNAEHPGSMGVVMSNAWAGEKWMEVYKPDAMFYDITGHSPQTITTNGDGWANFPCPARSVSVWLQM